MSPDGQYNFNPHKLIDNVGEKFDYNDKSNISSGIDTINSTNILKEFVTLNGLKIAQLNIQSLRPKVDFIQILLNENNIDILTLSETWLHEDIDDSEVYIPEYFIIRTDRPGHNSHGGTAMYVSQRVSFHRILDVTTTIFESCWIQIELKSSKPVILGVVYFPNKNSEYLNELDNILNQIENDDKEYIIAGDFNLNILDGKEKDKIDSLCYNQLSQLVEKPTRITTTQVHVLTLFCLLIRKQLIR